MVEIEQFARFQEELRQAQRGMADEAVRHLQFIALEAIRRVVLKTPVDRGPLRGNWQVTINVPATNVIPDEEAMARTPLDVVVDGERRLVHVHLGDVIWLVNNLPYAGVWESGGFIPADPGPSKDPREGRFGRILVKGGYSVQSPQGMVAVTVEELTHLF